MDTAGSTTTTSGILGGVTIFDAWLLDDLGAFTSKMRELLGPGRSEVVVGFGPGMSAAATEALGAVVGSAWNRLAGAVETAPGSPERTLGSLEAKLLASLVPLAAQLVCWPPAPVLPVVLSVEMVATSGFPLLELPSAPGVPIISSFPAPPVGELMYLLHHERARPLWNLVLAASRAAQDALAAGVVLVQRT